MTSIEETTGRVVMRGRLRGRWTLPSGVSWYIIGIYVLLAIIGPAGFVRVSPSWETCLGYTPAALAAVPFEQLIHADDRVQSGE